MSTDLALPSGWLDAVEAGRPGVIPADKQIPVESALERYLLHRESARGPEDEAEQQLRRRQGKVRRARDARNRDFAARGPSLGVVRTVAYVLAGVAMYIAFLEARATFGLAGPQVDAEQVSEAPRALNLEVFVRLPVRVRATVDGEVVDDVTLKPGEERTYRGDAGVELDVDQVGAVRLRLNGSPLAPLGRSDLPRTFRFVKSTRHDG